MQRQRRRERLLGELGSLLQSPLILLDLAQYASPLLVPGRILSPPSLALPACPYETLRVRPLTVLTILTNRLPFAGVAMFIVVNLN